MSGTSAARPVLPGFYPDPTVCRVGDVYHLACSSFEYFPGVPVWRSTDLVSWTQVGNALDRPEQLRAGAYPASSGIYAPTLRHRDGEFLLITTAVVGESFEHLLVRAQDPAGPWSDPVVIRGLPGIDPDLAWDADGVALVTYCSFVPGLHGIAQAAVDLTTGELLEEPRLVWEGTGLANPEGPHLYDIDGWWYLVIAEGGTERGHAVSVARSRSPRGPFVSAPDNPVLSHRSTTHPVQNVGHADLVRAPDGTWAMVHLGVRPHGFTPGFHVNGRETFLVGVDWVDGWPVVRADRYVPRSTGGFVDRFDGPQDGLHPRWVSPGRAPGDVVVGAAQDGAVLRREESENGSWSGLYARTRHERWRLEVRADVELPAPGGVAGVGVRLDDRHWCEVRVRAGRAWPVIHVGGIEQVGEAVAVPFADVVVAVCAQDPTTQGPDDVVLSVRGASGEWVELARVDGRYLSTEVAGGFTGRTAGVRAVEGTVRVREVAYLPAGH